MSMAGMERASRAGDAGHGGKALQAGEGSEF